MEHLMRFPLLMLLMVACGGGGGTTNASDLTEGTLAVERLPEDVVLTSELPAAGVTPQQLEDAIDDAVQDLDASVITEGTLPVSVLPPEVILEGDARMGGVAGVTVPDYDSNISLDGTTNKELLRLTAGPTTVGMALSASVQLEKAGSTTGRYEVTIREGDCSGAVVAMGIWRPGTIEEAYNAEPVPLVGFAAAEPTPVDYVLCGRKFDATAPTATAGPRGLIAHW
jgi:hypothetical protein